MQHRIFLFLLALIFSLPISAGEIVQRRVAVLEFRGIGVEEAVLLKLSDQSRGAAVDVLSKEQYLIMTRENMLQVLTDMGKDASCMEGACEVDIGRNIGADLIITGDILQMDGIYVLTLKLYETQSGALLKTQEVEDPNLFTLKGETYAQSVILLQEGLDLSAKRKRKKFSTGLVFRSPKFYYWVSGGLLASSISMYGITVSTHQSYKANPGLEKAQQLYAWNNLAHTTALSLSALSAMSFATSRIIAKKEEK